MPDPWEHWSAARIAAAAGVPQPNVETSWPHVVTQLDLCGINRESVQIGVIGTTAIETASTFLPIHEYGTEADWAGYEGGAAYAGRGFVQLTHLANYRAYTAKLEGLWGTGSPDLVAYPDLALDQDVASAVIALWFRDTRALPTGTWPRGYGLQDACDLADDEWIRRLVYGGADPQGQARIAHVRSMLATGAPPVALAYNPEQPPERQVQNWGCSIRATTWAAKSLGIVIDAGQLQDEMVPGTVTPALGLLDGRGYGIAAILGRHLPRGTRIEVVEGISWQGLAERAGRGPICLGSGSLYHWINVSKMLDGSTFASPNPAPAWQDVRDDLSEAEFSRWAPWNAVFVEVAPAAPPAPVAPATADLATLVGVAYHEDGTVIPALAAALGQPSVEPMRKEVENVIGFLRANNPDRAA